MCAGSLECGEQVLTRDASGQMGRPGRFSPLSSSEGSEVQRLFGVDDLSVETQWALNSWFWFF